jgi:hypothetical protein
VVKAHAERSLEREYVVVQTLHRSVHVAVLHR